MMPAQFHADIRSGLPSTLATATPASGTAAISRPAVELEIFCSAELRKYHGRMISTIV